MRFEGVITSWNDERGFGFVRPDQGGQDIFVHVKAFGPRCARPRVDQRISFEIELNRDAKKRACNVQPVALVRGAAGQRPDSPARWGTASFFAIPAFLLVYFVATLSWHVPRWVGLGYLVASAICFFAYAADKSAAMHRRERIPEDTLLVLGFLGGWPGAIVGQQLLRHKSVKASFRSAFWSSVVMNGAVFVTISSPFGDSLLRLLR